MLHVHRQPAGASFSRSTSGAILGPPG
jgi:hypothetical protein